MTSSLVVPSKMLHQVANHEQRVMISQFNDEWQRTLKCVERTWGNKN